MAHSSARLTHVVPALAVVLLIVSGCAGTEPNGDETTAMRRVSAEEADLMLDAPGLENATVNIVRREKGFEIQEEGHWQSSSSSWPEAALYLRRLNDLARTNRSYYATKPMSESVQDFFGGESIALGEAGTTSNRIGNVEFQRFERFGVIACVLVRQGRSTHADELSLPHGHDPLGDIIVMGWYCTDPRRADAEAAIRGFISGIGLRGFTDVH